MFCDFLLRDKPLSFLFMKRFFGEFFFVVVSEEDEVIGCDQL